MNDNPDDLREGPEHEAGARLIGRIVEREARPADYDAFTQLAGAAPSRWHELLGALRDDDVLHAALAPALEAAERVELPAPAVHGGVLRALRPWGALSGWLAAAALALLWFDSGPASPPVSRSLADGPSRQQARDLALEQPSGFAQPPLRLVGTEPAADGSGVDVLYWQPVLRRTRVNGVFEMAQDEHGRPAPVRVDPAVLAHHENL
jgi:hypothetical protein